MGGDSSKATGTDFKDNQKNKEDDNAGDDLPSIPFMKTKEVMAGLEQRFKTSIWLANFKRAFRGYLRQKCERGQEGVFQRVLQNAKRDADLLGLPRDSYAELTNLMVRDLAPIFETDTKEFLVESGKIKAGQTNMEQQSVLERNQRLLFSQLLSVEYIKHAKKIYQTFSRGQNAEESDVEIDDAARAQMETEKRAKLEKAAEERRKEAETWQKEAAEEEQANAAREAEIKRRTEEQKKIEAERDADIDDDLI